MSQVEDIWQVAVRRMIEDFRRTNRSPADTIRIMKQTALYSISVLLFGRALDARDQLLEMLMKYEKDLMKCIGVFNLEMLVLDRLPWLIHLPLQCNRDLKAFVELQSELWRRIRESQRLCQSYSFTKLLLKRSTQTNVLLPVRQTTVHPGSQTLKQDLPASISLLLA